MGSEYDRAMEVKAFDDTKAGVKGLVDAGVLKLPRMFIRPEDELNKYPLNSDPTHLNIPLIDLQGVDTDEDRRRQVVDEVGRASATFGFFQVVNHGIPTSMLSEIIEGVRAFNEQNTEKKRAIYSREPNVKVSFNSSWDLLTAHAACWRDTLHCSMAPEQPQPHEFPEVCRDVICKYSECAMRLGEDLFKLLSEALGLKPDHLTEMECAKACTFVSHYYPVCPEPELTLGTGSHTDPSFLTILLQDHIGGLQVLHQNTWVDLQPIPGALVINIGDLLQLITNNMFKSAEHRVLANNTSTRISVAFFFSTRADASKKTYGPIKELLSDDNPPIYKETLVKDFVEHAAYIGTSGAAPLDRFML